MNQLEKTESLQGLCTFCGKTFTVVKLLNRHMKKVHNIIASSSTESGHIICPLCEQRSYFRTYEDLGNHLKENHNVSIEVSDLMFSSKQEFEEWRDLEEVESTYALQRTKQRTEYKYFMVAIGAIIEDINQIITSAQRSPAEPSKLGECVLPD